MPVCRGPGPRGVWGTAQTTALQPREHPQPGAEGPMANARPPVSLRTGWSGAQCSHQWGTCQTPGPGAQPSAGAAGTGAVGARPPSVELRAGRRRRGPPATPAARLQGCPDAQCQTGREGTKPVRWSANTVYIYIYFSLLNIPQSLLTSNVDYQPRPRPRELPLPWRASAREDPAPDCHLPPGQGTAWQCRCPETQSSVPTAAKRQSSRPEEALGAAGPSSWRCRAWRGPS